MRIDRERRSAGLRRGTALAVAVALAVCVAALPSSHAAPARDYQSGNTIVVPQGGKGVRIAGFVAMHGGPVRQGTSAVVKWDDDGLTVILDCADKEIVAKDRARSAARSA